MSLFLRDKALEKTLCGTTPGCRALADATACRLPIQADGVTPVTRPHLLASSFSRKLQGDFRPLRPSALHQTAALFAGIKGILVLIYAKMFNYELIISRFRRLSTGKIKKSVIFKKCILRLPQKPHRSLAEFRHPQMTESNSISFSAATCAWQNTLLLSRPAGLPVFPSPVKSVSLVPPCAKRVSGRPLQAVGPAQSEANLFQKNDKVIFLRVSLITVLHPGILIHAA